MLMNPPPLGYGVESINSQQVAGTGGSNTFPGPLGSSITKPGLQGLRGLPQLEGSSGFGGANPMTAMTGMKMPGVGQPGMPGGGMLGGGAQGMGIGTNPMNMANILRR